MKTVIEMAQESSDKDKVDAWHNGFWTLTQEELERFAELVRADEREKYKWDVHSCGPTCKRYACVSMREAIEAEREACAKVCDDKGMFHEVSQGADLAFELATAIRARSNT